MNTMHARKRVALVTCEAFADLYEDDHLLVAAMAEICGCTIVRSSARHVCRDDKGHRGWAGLAYRSAGD